MPTDPTERRRALARLAAIAALPALPATLLLPGCAGSTAAPVAAGAWPTVI